MWSNSVVTRVAATVDYNLRVLYENCTLEKKVQNSCVAATFQLMHATLRQ